MSFLSPLFLFGAGAAVVPLVLHLLRRHPDAYVKFSAVRWLEHAPVEHARRRSLRDLLLLAMRVAALCLLAFAFARPYVVSTAAVAGGGAVVVAIDTSLSMAAPGQMRRAQDIALDVAQTSGSIGVVTFADVASVAQRLSTDRDEARRTIGAIVATEGSTDYRAAIATALGVLGDLRGRVVVVTDLQRHGWRADQTMAIPAGVDVEVRDVGAMTTNVAVTALRADGGQLKATIANESDTPRDVTVRVRPEGRGASGAEVITSARVGAGQATDVSVAAPEAPAAAVRVDDAEGLEADNVRYVVLTSAGRDGILVVSTTGQPGAEALFVGGALSTPARDGRRRPVEHVAVETLGTRDAAGLPEVGVVVLLSTRGLDHRGRALLSTFVAQGGRLLVGVGPDIDIQQLQELSQGAGAQISIGAAEGDAVSRREPPTAMAIVDTRHPALAVFGGRASLAAATFRQTVDLRADGCDVPARFSTGRPALLECSAGEGRLMILASDLSGRWNDFPRQATFLPFVQEVVSYLERRALASSFLVGHAPPEVSQQSGVFSVAGASAEPRLVSVNVDARESTRARLSEDEFRARLVSDAGATPRAASPPGVDVEARQRLWQWALVLMLAMLTAESAMAARAG